MQYVPLPRKLLPGEVLCEDCNQRIYCDDYTTQMDAIEDHLCGKTHRRNSSHRKPRVRPPGDVFHTVRIIVGRSCSFT